MSQMLEKCARAIYEACPIQDQCVDADGHPTSGIFNVAWESAIEDEGLYDCAI